MDVIESELPRAALADGNLTSIELWTRSRQGPNRMSKSWLQL